jgi:hypothetical protein
MPIRLVAKSRKRCSSLAINKGRIRVQIPCLARNRIGMEGPCVVVRCKSRIVRLLCLKESPQNALNRCKCHIVNMLCRKRRLLAVFGGTGYEE